MPDTPFFDSQVVPIERVGIPQHQGGFRHPNSTYRLVINADENTILGVLDRTTGFLPNHAINTMVQGHAENNGLLPLTEHHKVYFGGREVDMYWEFPTISATIEDYELTYALRIRNSMDLSVNKHVLIGISLALPEAFTDTVFMPVFPLIQSKSGRYGHLYTSQIRRYVDNAPSDFRHRYIPYFRAMNNLVPTRQEISHIATELSLGSYVVTRLMSGQGAESLLSLILAVIRAMHTTRNSGKSSASSLMFRRYTKIANFVNTFHDRITEQIERDRAATQE